MDSVLVKLSEPLPGTDKHTHTHSAKFCLWHAARATGIKNHVQTEIKSRFALSAKKFLRFYVSHVPTPTSLFEKEISIYCSCNDSTSVVYRISYTFMGVDRVGFPKVSKNNLFQ